jgi:hypothetical protein
MAPMAGILPWSAAIRIAFLAALLVSAFIFFLPLVEVAFFLVIGHVFLS